MSGWELCTSKLGESSGFTFGVVTLTLSQPDGVAEEEGVLRPAMRPLNRRTFPRSIIIEDAVEGEDGEAVMVMRGAWKLMSTKMFLCRERVRAAFRFSLR